MNFSLIPKMPIMLSLIDCKWKFDFSHAHQLCLLCLLLHLQFVKKGVEHMLCMINSLSLVQFIIHTTHLFMKIVLPHYYLLGYLRNLIGIIQWNCSRYLFYVFFYAIIAKFTTTIVIAVISRTLLHSYFPNRHLTIYLPVTCI